MRRPGDDLRVSVVICTYTELRWRELASAARSIGVQTRRADELILVIDHNSRLRGRAAAAHPQAKVITNTFSRGLSGARNSGVAAATGDVVAFLDDDAQAEPGWLAHLVASYTDPRVAGVGGAALPLWPADRPRWFPPEFDWVVGCSYVGLPVQTAPVRNPIGAGMSFRRAVFDRVGGFTEGLGRVGATPLGCEETEFGIRLRATIPHAVVLYEPRARVRHRVSADRASLRYFLARCHAEGLSKAAVVGLTGREAGLAAERQYLRRTLPRALGRDACRPGGWPRAGVVLAGAGSTAVGYARGRLRATSGTGGPGVSAAAGPGGALTYRVRAAAGAVGGRAGRHRPRQSAPSSPFEPASPVSPVHVSHRRQS
jgi:GT2 family glycosyltransferase